MIKKSYLVIEQNGIQKNDQKNDQNNKKYELIEGIPLSDQDNFPEKAGEVVFNTSHSGYEEIATDPSYFQQIVVMTAPMQGNYPVDSKNWESTRLWLSGFICVQMQSSKREKSWSELLIKNKIPVLTEVDTRELVINLREQGTPWGAIVQASHQQEAIEKAQFLINELKNKNSDWANECSRLKIEDRIGQVGSGQRVAVVDFGIKENILRELEKRSALVRVFPARTEYQVIKDWNPDSLLLSNGPGDPAKVQHVLPLIQYFLGKIPIFGICMGHQLLGRALGAQTYKMKFGHRGVNHPIQDLLLNQVYVSSQNHGYAINAETMPSDIKITHRNLNDQTVAGFYSSQLNCLGIQFHPESHPGPHEAVKLFDYFINDMHELQMKMNKKGNSIL